MRTFKVSETVNFSKKIEANSKEEAMTMFVGSMDDIVEFGEDLIEFRDVSCGATVKEIYL